MYVYESISYWDAEKGQSRSKRRVIGKLDPVTGEVIPTGKRGRTKKESGGAVTEASTASAEKDSSEESRKQIVALQMTVASLTTRIGELETELKKYQSVVSRIHSLSDKLSGACEELMDP